MLSDFVLARYPSRSSNLRDNFALLDRLAVLTYKRENSYEVSLPPLNMNALVGGKDEPARVQKIPRVTGAAVAQTLNKYRKGYGKNTMIWLYGDGAGLQYMGIIKYADPPQSGLDEDDNIISFGECFQLTFSSCSTAERSTAVQPCSQLTTVQYSQQTELPAYRQKIKGQRGLQLIGRTSLDLSLVWIPITVWIIHGTLPTPQWKKLGLLSINGMREQAIVKTQW